MFMNIYKSLYDIDNLKQLYLEKFNNEVWISKKYNDDLINANF